MLGKNYVVRWDQNVDGDIEFKESDHLDLYEANYHPAFEDPNASNVRVEFVGERNWEAKKCGRGVWFVTDGDRILVSRGEVLKFYSKKSADEAAWEARINGT